MYFKYCPLCASSILRQTFEEEVFFCQLCNRMMAIVDLGRSTKTPSMVERLQEEIGKIEREAHAKRMDAEARKRGVV